MDCIAGSNLVAPSLGLENFELVLVLMHDLAGI